MNKVTLIGRVTKDIETRYSDGGTAVARFTIAVDRKYKREGEPTADFISCLAFGKTAEFLEKYFRKGSGIVTVGRIQTGSYEKDGQRVYTTDVIIEEVEFPVGGKSEKGEASGSKPAAGNDGFMNIPDGIDEELPFN